MANETFVQAGKIILKAKQDIHDLLSDPAYSSVALTASHQLDQLVSRFHHLGGEAPIVTPTQQFGPITDFFGEKIERKEVKAADLVPTTDEKDIYVDKVKTLYDIFPQMHADKILNSYTIPEDVKVLRGVAKIAGVKNYHNKLLTVQFVEEIKEGIAKKAAEAEEQAQFEKDLKEKEANKGGVITPE